ncbi:MAG TPA: flagellar biosynthetic protein FliO [Opitutaceae bacterium]|jgi:flagellar protein FliO/FliZ|nr:flagellar biosynthetic protein FliO [Opitutaceae bacterium]
MSAPALAAASAPGTVLYPSNSGLGPDPLPKGQANGGVSVTAIVFVAACAAAGLWLWWRRRTGGPAFAGRTARNLEIAETRPLGNRQYLVVAAYEDRKFLLGVCPGRIQLLAPLDQDAPFSR